MPSTRTRVAKPKKVGRPERTARNEDWTDREMLGIIDEAAKADANGFASTTEIALRMGFTGNGDKRKTPAVKVATRLAWMRDAGRVIESIPPDKTVPYDEPGSRDTRWRLTEDGQMILNGTVAKTIMSAIDRMDSGKLVALQRELMRAGWIGGTQSTAFALNRQIQHDRAQRTIQWRVPKR